MEALVSVIVPVYNVSPYLREALDSVIHQTYRNLEILVIDDGSTDESGKICDEYLSDSRVIVIHQENRGLSAARNTGLDCATGDYIAFLDSDDIYHPDMINLLLQSLLLNNLDLSACVYTDFSNTHLKKTRFRYRDIKDIIVKERILSVRESIILLLEGSFPVNVWSKLYRRQLWDSLRFPEGYVYEDWRVMPYLLEKCNNIAFLQHTLVYHRLRKGSIIHTDTKKNLQDSISSLRMVLSYVNGVQPPLPSKCIIIYREKMLRSLIKKHIKLSRSKALLNSSGLEDILLKEIRNLSGNEPKLILTKTKVVWWMYRHCPGLLIPAQACFRLLNSILRKCKRGRL